MTQNEVDQFPGQVVDRDFLLDPANNSQIQLNESFTPDHKVIAVIATPESNIGKSIVLHETLGWFYVYQTTAQLINEFKSVNFFGFWVPKTIARIFNLKRHLPLVYLHTVYMPLSAPHRGPADWVGLHNLQNFYQKDGYAYFVTKSGTTFRLKFAKGHLSKKVHDSCFMSQYHVRVHQILHGSIGQFHLFKRDLGLINEFRDCKCELHLKLPTKRREAFVYLVTLLTGIAELWSKNNLAIDNETAVKENLSLFRKKKNL